ncbi:hypothetical protein [Wolbachia endosymbiont of Litomosoides brasiliensis]|uniref:hypothetical protein n=1 Tax=Wolbachia endosymbiont of Litomosoides brasiliensis TaxID=1812117 RepID=UPI00158E4AE0|nr:hypothetical protein [Wolbachia endosymbiont of Litomosoides brasiliensis]
MRIGINFIVDSEIVKQKYIGMLSSIINGFAFIMGEIIALTLTLFTDHKWRFRNICNVSNR